MLKNGSFTEGWETLSAVAGFLRNQRPNSWQLRWLEPGESLFGAGDVAKGIPECVHKLSEQLPDNEKLGGKDALILAGDTTYKIFSATAPFGAELKQTVTGLKAGSTAKLTVPVQVHLHGETDQFGAESGVWVNGEGEWVNGGKMGDRTWYHHTYEFTVPADGTAEIMIRVKSKWMSPKDFFIDGITLEAATAVTTDDTDSNQPTPATIQVKAPAGVSVTVNQSNDAPEVIITVPPHITVDLQNT